MSIIIGGDFVPTSSNADLFNSKDVFALIGKELKEVLDSASYRVFNLETPLADQITPIKKEGPNLAAPTKCAEGLKRLGVDLVTLANNHIMDQDTTGLKSTIKALSDHGISYVGAGNNSDEASRPFIVSVDNRLYGIYACAEHEFSIAEDNRSGANPFDPLETPDHIAQLKEKCEYVIVLYHGGIEQYRYPSPDLQRTCRKLIDKGADLVVCQHSHCVGCMEEYHGGTIVYGQGNFLFDHLNNEYWNSSILISISDQNKIDYIPIMKKGKGTRLVFDDERRVILESFLQRSKEIEKKGFIQANYSAFARKSNEYYMLFFSGVNRSLIFRIFNRLSGRRLQRLAACVYKKRRRLGLINYIDCEAHREIILSGLKQE